MEDAQERELALRRQGRFGFIEYEQPVLEPMLEQRQERFAVRLEVKRQSTVSVERAPHRLQIVREVIERLGTQNEAARIALSPPRDERPT
jgi:hypothetical protein